MTSPSNPPLAPKTYFAVIRHRNSVLEGDVSLMIVKALNEVELWRKFDKLIDVGGRVDLFSLEPAAIGAGPDPNSWSSFTLALRDYNELGQLLHHVEVGDHLRGLEHHWRGLINGAFHTSPDRQEAVWQELQRRAVLELESLRRKAEVGAGQAG